jgi:hypothetical protein
MQLHRFVSGAGYPSEPAFEEACAAGKLGSKTLPHNPVKPPELTGDDNWKDEYFRPGHTQAPDRSRFFAA